MTSALTAVVYLTLLSAGLALGDLEQRAAVVLVAVVVGTQLALRRRASAPTRRAASSRRLTAPAFGECPSPMTPLPRG